MRRWFARRFICPRIGHEWRRFSVVEGESGERTGQVVEVCVRCFRERELPYGDS